MTVPADADRLDERVHFVLEHQDHCRQRLGQLAAPEGKSVLVVGAGAGTEMLWAMSEGASEVVGIDIAPQPIDALDEAARRLGLDHVPHEVHQLDVAALDALDRTFDLVLSNNVFEHLPDLESAFRACARRIEPGHGRIAIFTDPLFYSSTGSHLEHEPWEHLWGDPEDLLGRLRAELPPGHQIHDHDLHGFFDTIGLNRMRCADFYRALSSAGLQVHHLHLVSDRSAGRLADYLERLGPIIEAHDLTVADLGVEGIACELGLPGPQDDDETSSFFVQWEYAARDAMYRVEGLEAALAAFQESPSYRLGRALTWPLRTVRDLLRR